MPPERGQARISSHRGTQLAERFAFGANWQRYLRRSFSEERVAIAGRWMLDFLGRPSLDGVSVLDVGCGSGIHSLAALRAGAGRIVSFDYDPQSVAATRGLHQRAGSPAHWTVLQGSVLDEGFMAGLGAFDLVYSWGVLHHTGDLWRGLANCLPRVGADGRLYVALYAREHTFDPGYWLELKRRYNRANPLRRRAMEAAHVWRMLLGRDWRNLPRLPRLAAEYRRSRGMAVLTDVRDWLGGWPMEFSSVREVHGFAASHGLALVKLATGQLNSEYLFAPRAAGVAEVAVEEVAVARLPVLGDVADLPPGPWYIFGTARGAELLLREARAAGREPAGFVDIARTEPLAGLPVHHVDAFVTDRPKDVPVVLSNSHVQRNAERLWRHGFGNLWNAHPLVVDLMLGVRARR